nr:DUF3179 domain-containing (seleno)protein [Sinorhizobium sojae]
MVIYDRQTESWWQQFGGEAIVGQLAGRSLEILPSRLESLESFRARAPRGRVLGDVAARRPRRPKVKDPISLPSAAPPC